MPELQAAPAITEKTPKKTPKPGRNGNALPQAGNPGNSGGKKGRSGRKPNSFKQFLASLRANPVSLAALERASQDEKLKSFGNVWKLAAEYDEEKPQPKQEFQGNFNVRVVFAHEGSRRTAS